MLEYGALKIHSSIKQWEHWPKLSKSTFTDSRICQKLAAIWEEFIQEKWQNLVKNNKLCCNGTCPTLMSFSPVLPQPGKPAASVLLLKQHTSCQWRGKNGFGAHQKALSSKNCHYLICLAEPWKSPINRDHCI